MSGVLYLIGVGAGDPELLTLKAARVLGEVDVVAYGFKPDTNSVALNIVKSFLPDGIKYLPIKIPMQVEREPAKNAYNLAVIEIEKQLREGKNLAYICEGDPLFYASAMYLLSRISDDIKVEIMPGITSLSAASAAISRPLVARNEVLKILPAPLEDERLLAELKTAQAVAIIKVGRHFKRIKKLLEKTGFTQDARIIINASCENESVLKLSEYNEDILPYFSIILCYRGDENWKK